MTTVPSLDPARFHDGFTVWPAIHEPLIERIRAGRAAEDALTAGPILAGGVTHLPSSWWHHLNRVRPVRYVRDGTTFKPGSPLPVGLHRIDITVGHGETIDATGHLHIGVGTTAAVPAATLTSPDGIAVEVPVELRSRTVTAVPADRLHRQLRRQATDGQTAHAELIAVLDGFVVDRAARARIGDPTAYDRDDAIQVAWQTAMQVITAFASDDRPTVPLTVALRAAIARDVPRGTAGHIPAELARRTTALLTDLDPTMSPEKLAEADGANPATKPCDPSRAVRAWENALRALPLASPARLDTTSSANGNGEPRAIEVAAGVDPADVAAASAADLAAAVLDGAGVDGHLWPEPNPALLEWTDAAVERIRTSQQMPHHLEDLDAWLTAPLGSHPSRALRDLLRDVAADVAVAPRWRDALSTRPRTDACPLGPAPADPAVAVGIAAAFAGAPRPASLTPADWRRWWAAWQSSPTSVHRTEPVLTGQILDILIVTPNPSSHDLARAVTAFRGILVERCAPAAEATIRRRWAAAMRARAGMLTATQATAAKTAFDGSGLEPAAAMSYVAAMQQARVGLAGPSRQAHPLLADLHRWLIAPLVPADEDLDDPYVLEAAGRAMRGIYRTAGGQLRHRAEIKARWAAALAEPGMHRRATVDPPLLASERGLQLALELAA